jgi:hypothetical protein
MEAACEIPIIPAQFGKFLEGQTLAAQDAFYFGNFARQFALAPETSDGPAMRAAE